MLLALNLLFAGHMFLAFDDYMGVAIETHSLLLNVVSTIVLNSDIATLF